MAESFVVGTIFFVLGLLLGSFLNVVVIRLEGGVSLGGRSKCVACNHVIPWHDNIPLLSFLLLRGRCRFCHKRLSWQYPGGEFATALLFALFGLRFFSGEDVFSWGETVWVLGVVFISLAVAFYDARTMEIPLSLVGIGVVWTLFFLLWADLVRFVPSPHFSLWNDTLLYRSLVAALGGFFFFFFLWAFSRGKWMGEGDAYVAFFLGLVLGWPLLWSALLLAFLLGSLYGVALIGVKKLHLKSQIPFGPFLLASLLMTLLFREELTLFWRDVFLSGFVI